MTKKKAESTEFIAERTDPSFFATTYFVYHLRHSKLVPMMNFFGGKNSGLKRQSDASGPQAVQRSHRVAVDDGLQVVSPQPHHNDEDNVVYSNAPIQQESYPQQFVPAWQSPPVAPEKWDTQPQERTQPQTSKRKFDISTRLCWLIIIVIVLIVCGIVAGVVGGVMANRNSSKPERYAIQSNNVKVLERFSLT